MKHKFLTALVFASLMPLGSAWASDALSVSQARTIVAPLYQALNASQKDNVKMLLEKATTPEWESCSGEGKCVSRYKAVDVFKSRSETIPDLKWEIKDVMVAGDSVVVRGEATGTPVKPFLGVIPTGKSFKIMSIDIQQISKGKIVHSYHVEDWETAAHQLAGK